MRSPAAGTSVPGRSVPRRGEKEIGLVGVVLAHDGAPAPSAVIARADAADQEDDEEHEKEEGKHE